MAFKISLKDIAGNYPQKRGRKTLPIVAKHRKLQTQLSKVAIGHIDPQSKEIVYNEMIDHPKVKAIWKKNR